jgi:hypothetical protein
MTDTPALSNDAAMVLGLAGTAMPFAASPEEEAERWLRVLRLHGDVSASLQALGIGEVPITGDGHESGLGPAGEHHKAAEHEVVKNVTEHATRSAQRRGVHTVGTVDVLIGAMEYYGEDFDRILQAYGTDREEVLERVLAAS